MKKIMEIISEIKGIETTVEDFENEVIIAFGDYEEEGKTYVIVSKQKEGEYLAYIDTKDSTQIKIITKEIDEKLVVLDAWVLKI